MLSLSVLHLFSYPLKGEMQKTRFFASPFFANDCFTLYICNAVYFVKIIKRYSLNKKLFCLNIFSEPFMLKKIYDGEVSRFKLFVA